MEPQPAPPEVDQPSAPATPDDNTPPPSPLTGANAPVAPLPGTGDSVAELALRLEAVGYPIGWTWDHDGSWIPYPKPQFCNPVPIKDGEKTALYPSFDCALDASWLLIPFGWLITAFAIMLGAPFWFAVLNKIMVIRSTVKPKEKSGDEASEDRRPAGKLDISFAQPAAKPG